MSIKDLFLKFAGKENFELDSEIDPFYMARVCWKYGWMMIRGRILSLLYHDISKEVFIGKHVKIINKKDIKLGKKVKLHDSVFIDALSTCKVIVEDGVVIGRGTRIECTGGLQNIGKGVLIGKDTTFGNDCFFGAAGGIEIGNDVVAGQYIRFHSENHNYSDLNILIKKQGVTHEGIKIGNNCWIGAGVVFLDGCELGDGCVVAANAVVTKKFSANCVIGGVPAKILKYRGV